ncbi:endonuclease NucS domain-containing protein [Heyndrickxia oleronia]|uniref:endonuclease NucS domain-containing protein n=1 Tax=Heyndrickxia oleronia TaxID=38875 RepID=UPI003F299E95
MENISFDLDIDEESVFIKMPKRKSKSMAMYPQHSSIKISKRIIEKIIWGNDELVPHGETLEVEKVLDDINKFRHDMYTEIKEKYLGQNIIITDEHYGRVKGYITDISLEEGIVNSGIGNIEMNTECGTCICDLPTEEKLRRGLESEIKIESQKWFETNYKDIANSMNDSLLESIKMDIKNVKSESDLEKYLKTRLHLIEDGLRLIDTQYEVKGGIIDILARDKNDNLCIIELKVNSKPKELIWQCLYYPLQFKDEIGLRMITVAPKYDDSIKVILDKIPYVEMKTYSINGIMRIE